MTFVKFKDLENDTIHYGVQVADNIGCACCGGVFPKDEEGETFEILDSYSGNMTEVIREAMED